MPFQKGHPKPKNAYTFSLGNKHPNWKGGISKVEGYSNQKRKEWRHNLGISKSYNSQTSGIKYSKKQRNQAYKRRVRMGGKLPLQRIQMLYEDNIKRFGTLTCIYCLNPIIFGQDTIDHRIPLSRNGTNEYSNLAIACRKCNCKKHAKTEKEYRKEV